MEHRSLAPDLVIPIDNDPCPNQLSQKSSPDVAPQELLKTQQMEGPVNCSPLELSTYLQALAAGFLPTFYSGTTQCVRSKTMSIASRFYQRGKKTVFFHGFPSLTMCSNLTANPGKDLPMSYLAGFPVKTFQAQEKALELKESDQECGEKWRGSLAKYDPDSRSWKTAQCLLLGGLEQFSETWPRWGLMRNGESSALQPLVPRISENESGFLDATPTKVMPVERELPTARIRLLPSGRPRKSSKKGTDGSLNWAQLMLHKGLLPTPMLCEFYMGWPIGYTDLKPLEMGKYQLWQQQHGECLAAND